MKLIFANIVLLFTLSVSGAAQTPASATVPMTFDGPVAIIEVMVNGHGPYHFTMDTGGGMQADIDVALVSQLGLQPTGKARAGDPSGRNVRELDTYELDSIKVGNAEFRKVPVIAREQRMGPNAPRVDGILGFALFKDYLLTLDYPRKQLRIASGELPPANGRDILSFESPRRIPVIDLMVGDRKVRAHLDSGNGVGKFVLPASLVEQLSLASPAVVVGRARTLSNDVEIKEAKLADTIHLGSFDFPQPTITFPAIADEANIGFKALRDFALTFDQKNLRVKFERGAVVAEAPSIIANAAEYAGNYGERTIFSENGELFLQRQGGPKLRLVAAAKDEFTLEPVPAARIKFIRDDSGKIVELRVLNRDGEWETAKRVFP